MNKIIEMILIGVVINLSNLCIWSKLLNKNIDFKSKKIYVTLIFMIVTVVTNYFYMNQFIRILIATSLSLIFVKIIFKEKLNKCVLTAVMTQMIYMLSEFIFACIISLVFNSTSDDIVNNQFWTFTANLIISLISIIIINIPITSKIYNLFIKITDRIKNNHLIISCFFLVLIINILFAILYFKINFSSLLIFNTLLTLFCFSIVSYSFHTKNNYIKVYDKYNTTLNSLKEYEDILDRYRISNHENKNELLTIRNMLPETDKKTISYIDTIIKNKLKDNDKVMLEAAKIPTGGLRGLIYSKILTMKELNISYELEISKDVKTVDLINNIDDSAMLDICKIIGVYVDNSIQAVENLKDKYINIEMYLDKSKLIISISNNYEGIIEIDKLENHGYTTKEKGHGYGLALAKEIIDNNKKLSNEKKITKETFTQILKIKM